MANIGVHVYINVEELHELWQSGDIVMEVRGTNKHCFIHNWMQIWYKINPIVISPKDCQTIMISSLTFPCILLTLLQQLIIHQKVSSSTKWSASGRPAYIKHHAMSLQGTNHFIMLLHKFSGQIGSALNILFGVANSICRLFINHPCSVTNIICKPNIVCQYLQFIILITNLWYCWTIFLIV